MPAGLAERRVRSLRAAAVPAGGLRRRALGVRSAATAASWLYVYSVMWLTAYTFLSVLVFGWKPVVITGGSMEPSIARGDLVMVAEVREQLGPGTVLTFRTPAREGLVTHRVRQVLPDGYRTRGDANAVDDSDTIAPAQVEGAGRLLVPLLGRPMVWLRAGEVVPFAIWFAASAAALVLVTRKLDPEADAVGVPAPEPVGEAVPVRTWSPTLGPACDVLPTLPAARAWLRPVHG